MACEWCILIEEDKNNLLQFAKVFSTKLLVTNSPKFSSTLYGNYLAHPWFLEVAFVCIVSITVCLPPRGLTKHVKRVCNNWLTNSIAFCSFTVRILTLDNNQNTLMVLEHFPFLSQFEHHVMSSHVKEY